MYKPLRGIIPATPTPMTEDGSIFPDYVPTLMNHLVSQKVQGIFACGTTGEFASLTVNEQIRMLEAFRDATPSGISLIAHVGRGSVAEACEVSKAAARMQVDRVSIAPPHYYKIGDARMLTEICARVAESADGLPFYYYHIPALSGTSVMMRDFVPLAIKAIPNFKGVKFTNENLMDFMSCVDEFGECAEMIYGRDEMLLAGIATGADAAIGSTFNYMAPVYAQIMQSFQNGDHVSARRWQARAVSVIRLFSRYGGSAVTKAMMKIVGVDCGPNRQPLRNHAKEERTALKNDLEKTGFFEWRNGNEL